MAEPSWLSAHEPRPTINTITTNQPFEPLSSSSTAAPGCPNFKVILIGDAGVGKTSLFNAFRHPSDLSEGDSATLTSAATIGVDTCNRTFLTRYGHVTLTVWDTAGVERYRTLTRNYYRNSHAALLVYSLDDQSTLYSLPRWLRDVIDSAPSAVHFLVGNKSDLFDQEVTKETMETFAGSHGCQAAFVTSAKTGDGIESALMSVSEFMVEKYRRHSDMKVRNTQWMNGSGLQVHNAQDSKSRKCC